MDKEHQSSETSYQIRINGTPFSHHSVIGHNEINDFLELCEIRPNDYVDIVSIRTEIIMSQCNYNLMKKHFNPPQGDRGLCDRM